VNIGKGIRFVRVASGLRQGEIAHRLGISQNYLSLLENNKAEPSMALLKKMSQVFGIPASFLLWEEAAPFEGGTPEIAEKYERIRSLAHEIQKLRIARTLEGHGNQADHGGRDTPD
jgi:transcriptional regulator with XRE-family HTH domain